MSVSTEGETKPAGAPTGRLAQLDALRCLAIVLVLGRHMSPGSVEAGPTALRVWERAGWIGVDLFFVLSGFLVGGLILEELRETGGFCPGRFLLRRGFKIYPSFYVFLVLGSIAASRYGYPHEGKRLLAEAAFVQNYAPRIWNHTWSLAVEEHFYLLLALFAWGASRRRGTARDPLALLRTAFLPIALLCLGLRFWGAWQHPFDHGRQLEPTHLRLDALLFGVLIAHWRASAEADFAEVARRYALPLLFGGLILLSPALWLDEERSMFLITGGLTLNYLGFGALLIVVVGRAPPSGRNRSGRWRVLAMIGRSSYSIYLWHMLIRRAVGPFARSRTGIDFTPLQEEMLYLVASLIGGMVMGWVIERPFLILRERLVPSGRALGRGRVVG